MIWKFAFLSYTYGTNGISIPYGKEYLVNVYSDEQAKEDIEKIKETLEAIKRIKGYENFIIIY